jgi:cytidylate kinase
MSNDLRIAISGKSGCGNTTVSRLVASRLGLHVINYTFKDLARDKGMSFEELAQKAETDPQYDHAVDRLQIEMALREPCVLGSRLAIWLLRDKAFTAYLEAPPEVRAARIARREGLDFATALEQTEARDRRDRERYRRLYGYNVDDYGFASLIVRTEHLSVEEETALIVEEAMRNRG